MLTRSANKYPIGGSLLASGPTCVTRQAHHALYQQLRNGNETNSGKEAVIRAALAYRFLSEYSALTVITGKAHVNLNDA